MTVESIVVAVVSWLAIRQFRLALRTWRSDEFKRGFFRESKSRRLTI